MSEQEYRAAQLSFAGVTLARTAAAIVGIWDAVTGDLAGAAVMALAWALLHFAKPVQRDR